MEKISADERGKAPPRGRATPTAMRALKACLLAAVLAFVGRYVAVNWQQIRDVPVPRLAPLAWATLMGVVSCVAMAGIVVAVLRDLGARVTLGQAIGLRFLPPLGKYLPGKFWSLIASLWLFVRMGVPRHIAITAIGLNLIIGLLSQCLVVLAMQAQDAQHAAVTGTMIGLSAAMIVGLHPRIFYPSVNWVFRRIGQPPLSAGLSFASLAGLVVVSSVTWALWGLAQYCVLVSVAPLPLADAPQCIGMFLFAQVVGFVALFAPAGIGVREGVLLVSLGPLIGAGPAIVVAALTRLWQTALELALAGIGWRLLGPPRASESSELEDALGANRE